MLPAVAELQDVLHSSAAAAFIIRIELGLAQIAVF
jgi:hypothetical protein